MKIAWLGLGAMGRRMAQRMLRAGHDLVVYNRSTEAVSDLVSQGASAAATPAQAARDADAIIAMVADDLASREIWTDPESGALRTLRTGALAIECSTLSIAHVDQLAALLEARGATFAAAPVIGSLPQAEDGALQCALGATSPAAFERAEPLVRAFSDTVHALRSPHEAAAFKLCVNAWLAAQITSAREVLALADVHGLEAERCATLFQTLPLTSPAMKTMIGLMAADDRRPRFPIRLMAKDLEYALAGCEGRFALLEQCRQRFRTAAKSALAEQNMTAIPA